MKKMISALLFCAIVLAIPAMAEMDLDLSSLSYYQLLTLKEQVDIALWACDEWQEVTVPAGSYIIGRDIPAGYWTITPVKDGMAIVSWGTSLDESGTEVDWKGLYANSIIMAESHIFANESSVNSVSWNLTEGTALVIESSSVIFTPFTGNSFGFK